VNSRRDLPKASGLHAGRRFAEDFPSVADVRVEVTELSMEGEQTSVYTLGDQVGGPFALGMVSGFIDCSNPACFGGGLYIDSILHEMVREGRTTFESKAHCRGYEGTRTKKARDCLHFFHVKVALRYKT